MESIPMFNKFFEIVAKDDRLSITDLCIYLALFQCWNKNHFQNPIRIKRIEIMQLAKITAKTTYHKCIKQLQNCGYIQYEPSYKPEGSLVYLNISSGLYNLSPRLTSESISTKHYETYRQNKDEEDK